MILYLFSAITALLLVCGQSLWKLAANNLDKSAPLIPSLLKVLFTVQFIGGAILYVIATLAYVWMFSKYQYSSVQLSLISFSIILSSLMAILFFKEHFLPINFLGIAILILGLFLVTWKA